MTAKRRSIIHGFLLLGLAVSLGCKPKPDYSAETWVEGIVITVSLKQAHPFLAEYTREIKVEINGRSVEKPLIVDSGGYAWVVLANDHGNLEIKTIGDLLRFPATLKDFGARQYLGRFDFERKGSLRRYHFISALSDKLEPQVP